MPDQNQEVTQQNQMTVVQKPKVTLAQILDGFQRSVNNVELDEANRSFAAKLMQLTNYIQYMAARNTQVNAMLVQRVATLEAHLKELIDLIGGSGNPQVGQAAPQQNAPTPQAVPDNSENAEIVQTSMQTAGAHPVMPQSPARMAESAAAEATRINHTARAVPVQKNGKKQTAAASVAASTPVAAQPQAPTPEIAAESK